jgi:hypothetical protein
MYTYRKQVSPDPTTAASTTGYTIYSLDINSIATYKMADVEIIASLITNDMDPITSTIYYRKLQIVDDAVTPDYTYLPVNSSYTYKQDPAYLFLSSIVYTQSGSGKGTIDIKTTNPTGASVSGTCFVHFKINFY